MTNAKAISIFAAALLLQGTAIVSGQEKVNYEDHVRPIFRDKCFSCHNTNKKSADLDLTTYTSLMTGGASGAVIEPGSSDGSYLYALMSHVSEPYMPPNADRLPDATLDVVRKWIEGGAPETSSSKVMIKKQTVNLTVEVSAGVRPEGPAPMPDVLNLEPVVHTGSTTAVSAIATSPWAKLVAVAGQKQVILYHSETMQPLGVLPFPEGQARVLKFSRNGALLLAGGGHGAARGLAVVWDVRTGERMMEVGDELDEVLAADISADQTLIALGGPQKIVRVYNTGTKELVYEIAKHTDWIYSLEFSPDNVLLATSDRNGGLHVWESYTGREYLTLAGHTAAVTSVSWRGDGNVLASGSEDGTIRLWEMENGGQIKNWGAHGGGVFSIEYTRDGRLVSSGRDKVTKLWDGNGGALRSFEAFADLALQATHCDETDRVVAGDWTGEIRVWNAADGTRLGQLSTNPPMLEQRVAEAESLLAPADAAMKAAADGQALAASTLKMQQEKVAAAQKTQSEIEKLVVDTTAAVQELEKQVTAATAAQTTQQALVSSLKKAIPELNAAAVKAVEASSTIQSDEELKKIAGQLQAQVVARNAKLSETETALVATTETLAKLNESLAKTKQSLTDYSTKATAAKAATEKEVAAVEPLNQALASADANLVAAQSEVNRVNTLIARWKNYVALRDELAALELARKERDSRQLAALEIKAVMEEKTTEVSSNQSAAEKARMMMTAAEQTMKQKLAEMAEVQKLLDVQQKQLAQREMAQPMVVSALNQAKAALAVLAEDAEIKASAATLENIVQRQEKEIVADREQVVAMTQAAAKLNAESDAAAKAMSDAQMQMVAAQKMVQQLEAESEPIKVQVQQAEAELQAVELTVQKAEEVVEARREQIRPQLQLTSR